MNNKKVYFASDFHLGFDSKTQSSTERESLIVGWLDEIKDSVGELFLVGDTFDHWYEYKSVIPKGYSRFLAKIRELRDADIPVHLFTGNHDIWLKSYFEKEYGITIYREAVTRQLNGKKFHIAHGDGLGPGDKSYKFMKKVFTNRTCQWLFSRLHPNFALYLMKRFSKMSRESESGMNKFLGTENEWLVQYAESHPDNDIDYFIFGHRHLPIHMKLSNGRSRYINLGEWISQRSYAVFDGQKLNLEFYNNEEGTIYP